MLKRNICGFIAMLVGVIILGGCAGLGDGIPPEKLGEYALIECHVSMRGRNMDTLPDSMLGRDNYSVIGWVNGKSIFPARQAINVLPGEYTFQVGLNCDNTATCRPGSPYKLNVKPGMRYVLLPNEVLVSDRSVPRPQAKEVRY